LQSKQAQFGSQQFMLEQAHLSGRWAAQFGVQPVRCRFDRSSRDAQNVWLAIEQQSQEFPDESQNFCDK
jgi:hypothetical protein